MSDATQPEPSLRIVMVTSPSRRADQILRSLEAAGLGVSGIVIDRGRLGGRKSVRRTRQVLRSSGVRATMRRIQRRLRRAIAEREATSESDERYTGFGVPVHHVDDINSAAAKSLLAELAPDLVVLGTSRIIDDEVIATPRLGALNAHPGWLPTYRGVDVVGWAVLGGGPLGVTVHWVDSGIDTGASLAREQYEIEPGDTLTSLHERADALAGRLMADVVGRIARGETITPIDHGDAPGALYTRMSPEDKDRVRAILARPGD